MLLKNTSTTSQTVRLTDSWPQVTVLPWQVVNVPEYWQAKEIMWMNTNFDEVLYSDDLRQTTISISSAELLALNTAPKQIVVAPWAGYGILVERAVVSLDYNSAAYATNTSLYVTYDSSTAGDGAGANTLSAAIDAILLVTADTVSVTTRTVDESNIVLNKWITAFVWTGDPTAWNSPIKMTVYYRIIAV